MSRLTSAPVPGLVRELAVPASMGIFFNTMYNVVDTWYAGRFDTQALAALSLSFPIFFVLLSMSLGMSHGVTALIGNALGRKNRRQAALISAQGVVLSLMMVLVIVPLAYLLGPRAYRMLGADGPYLAMCLEYMNIIIPGTAFVFVFSMFNGTLTAQGDTRAYRDFLLVATAANIILDPVLMYGWFGLPALGVRGIALATVMVQFGGMIFLGLRSRRTGLLNADEGALWQPHWPSLRAILGQGIPAGLNLMATALGVFVITFFIADFGSAVVAAFGAAMRIEQIVFLPALGLNVAALSLTSQNFGAGKIGRIHEVVQTALKYGAGLMLVGSALLFFGARFLMALFTPDAHVVAIGAHYLRIMAFVQFSHVVLFINTAVLQGVKQPAFGLWMGLYRHLLLPILCFGLLARWLDWGLDGIWWSIFVINWSAAALSVWYARRQVAKLALHQE